MLSVFFGECRGFIGLRPGWCVYLDGGMLVVGGLIVLYLYFLKGKRRL